MLEKTKGQFRETGKTGHTRRRKNPKITVVDTTIRKQTQIT